MIFTYARIAGTSDIRRSDGLQIQCLDGICQYEEYKAWIAVGNSPSPAPQPTQQEQFSAIERAFDQHIDAVAEARGYGRVGVRPSASCIGFAGFPNQWQAEAIKFAQWSSTCCALMIQGQQDVISGVRPMPTPEQAIAELPVMVW